MIRYGEVGVIAKENSLEKQTQEPCKDAGQKSYDDKK